MVELNGIELGASRCGTTESIPTRFRPSACRSDRSPTEPKRYKKMVELNGIEPSAS
jgi:hypothetical protein